VFCTVVNLWVMRKLGTTLWDHRLGIFVVDKGINAKRWLISFGLVVAIWMSISLTPESREVAVEFQKRLEAAKQESADKP